MSLVKGGGRAYLSPENEELIVSLLYDSRQSKNPLLPKYETKSDNYDNNTTSSVTNDNIEDDENGNCDEIKDTQKKKKKKNKVDGRPFCELSDHDKKYEKRQFLKRLVKCHNRQVLAMKINGPIDNHAVEENNHKPISDAGFNTNSNTHSGTQKPKSEKVRVDIVEAIFKDSSGGSSSSSSKKSSSKKSSSKSKKSKDRADWKEGTRKTMVFPCSITIQDFMLKCKSKLNMKKPTRAFYVDRNSKLQIDLTKDLSGLDDGDVVFLTSFKPSKEKSKETSTTLSKQSNNSSKGSDKLELDNDAMLIDPLESIKRVYESQQRQMRSKSRNIVSNDACQSVPPFTESLDNLETLSESRLKLPAAKYRSEILTSLDTSRVVVICGATGCGKSTQVPQYILEGMKSIGCESQANILVTQPRRVAATSLAMRVSNERSSPAPGQKGSEVGYNVRLSKATTDTTKITYCTVGVLLRMLVNSPHQNCDENLEENDCIDRKKSQKVPLSHVSHIIIDEVHERDLNTDFALTLLRPLLYKNQQISIILMSATASSELFVNYFCNSNLEIEPKVLNIPGRTFPVETKWLVDCERLLSKGMNGWNKEFPKKDISNGNQRREDETSLSPQTKSKIDNHFIAQLIKKVSEKQWNEENSHQLYSNNDDKNCGAILVFLPGKGEIQSLSKILREDSSLGDKKKCSILQLHSSLSSSDQWLAFQPVKFGTVKIILATNVAETSITIPDVSIVIDTGRVKESRFNSDTRVRELVTVWTSQASAKQRVGRAGRTGPGVCYKLYSEEFSQSMMLLQTPPEIVRTPLEELVLQVCLLKEHESNKGTSPMKFLSMAPEPPAQSRLEEACNHLLQIGALTSIFGDDEAMFRLTPLGYHLSHLPMDPKVGKIMVVGCILKCIEPALTIAASLSFSKSCWLSYIPGVEDSHKQARKKQEELIWNGFGGKTWAHGRVEGDSIGVIAAFNSWQKSGKNNWERKKFANRNALDHNALLEINGLRNQFRDALKVSGLMTTKNIESQKKKNDDNDFVNYNSDNNMDALLTSCCLVAGLYPNIATLMRPSREKRIFSAGLITKDGIACRVSSSSFQGNRIKSTTERAKDAYAVYHSKHHSVSVANVDARKERAQIFLSEVNFVSRFGILLFGGEIKVSRNHILVDEWLKFKVVEEKESGEKVATEANAILIQELRRELDNVLLKRIVSKNSEAECDRVVEVVRRLLSEE